MFGTRTTHRARCNLRVLGYREHTRCITPKICCVASSGRLTPLRAILRIMGVSTLQLKFLGCSLSFGYGHDLAGARLGFPKDKFGRKAEAG